MKKHVLFFLTSLMAMFSVASNAAVDVTGAVTDLTAAGTYWLIINGISIFIALVVLGTTYNTSICSCKSCF